MERRNDTAKDAMHTLGNDERTSIPAPLDRCGPPSENRNEIKAHFQTGAAERKPPIPLLNIEIIQEVLTNGRRFVACFVASKSSPPPGAVSAGFSRRARAPNLQCRLAARRVGTVRLSCG
jgi:hypothetical protein